MKNIERSRSVFIGRFGVPEFEEHEIAAGNLVIPSNGLSAAEVGIMRDLMWHYEKGFVGPVTGKRNEGKVTHNVVIAHLKTLGGLKTELLDVDQERNLVRTTIKILRRDLSKMSGYKGQTIVMHRDGENFRNTAYELSALWVSRIRTVPPALLRLRGNGSKQTPLEPSPMAQYYLPAPPSERHAAPHRPAYVVQGRRKQPEHQPMPVRA